ncbi:class I SAM-dependent methyltransferase [Streptomyces sedi]|uniref:Class I SAM-dependent methyltransferase n=1 Tax=Streptomyces sedi TaxID=555059 RepID=A0A5C4VAK1_9ACTN|nr:class I SAM-dependent methyltransferase [Streptomyces sedi]TNM32954.1 class I SAM-dependent methyltransferase [Streptomyces sedi]
MTDWSIWQKSWDRQQEWYLPDREERFRVMLDAVEALVGDRPRILDLACGTGSITARALRRFPGAVSVGVDLDPALLAIAEGTFADEPRATFVTADLTDPDWAETLPHDSYDAVLTATALHWLTEEPLRALYGRLATLVRPGGVFLNADHMPHREAPRIEAAVAAYESARRTRERSDGSEDWADWWARAAAAPELAEATAARFRIYGDPARGDHADGRMFPLEWHVRVLREAGFAEARAAWASLSDMTVMALR